MGRKLLWLSLFIVLFASCKKNKDDGDQFTGSWVREGTDGSGAGNRLNFTYTNGEYKMGFETAASAGGGVPAYVNTPYKYENGKLSYKNYIDPYAGYYTMNSFTWVETGKSFEVNSNELLLYMSAVYKVKFVKTN